ncbi:unnamed protein product [Lactuca saligna]|uniref:Uncharacterized protein n=1 Tax=Lactuca saligna TaxID=75948 RepID=A0AA35V1K9_LACSI|nr:unnamed protein product [Lactuca saligna]
MLLLLHLLFFFTASSNRRFDYLPHIRLCLNRRFLLIVLTIIWCLKPLSFPRFSLSPTLYQEVAKSLLRQHYSYTRLYISIGPLPQNNMTKFFIASLLSLGQHCGDNQNKFANDCGVVTRKLISIEYPTWKKVPANEKENLWLTIKKRWKIHDENRKSYVLMTCNHKWRSYKKRLKKKFLVNENERNPLESYSYLEKTTLQKFKERISSTEFQDISEKARMSSMCNTNPARVGPHGYRGNKAKWEQEKASGQLPSQLYEIKSERSLDYVLGRRSKNESGSKIIPPIMEPIVKKLIDVQKEISEGDLLLGPGEDLLSKAIGSEHPGRTRAVGHDIGLRKGMQGLDKKKEESRGQRCC